MEFKDVFRRVAEVLDATAIPYMLTGSFASSYYGALRSTHDIDFVIAASAPQVSQFCERLQAADYYADEQTALDALRERSMFNAIDNQTGWKIDFIYCKAGLYAREAFQRRKAVEFQQTRMFVATAEDVVVAKLEWAKMGESHRQLEDVAGVVKKQKQALDFPYIEKWVKELDLNAQWGTARKLAGLE